MQRERERERSVLTFIVHYANIKFYFRWLFGQDVGSIYYVLEVNELVRAIFIYI